VLSPDRKGVSDLFILGERGTIFAIFAGLVISFLLCGYWYPYWRLADMDVMMAYQGLLVNEGHAQDFFDHPGHLSILLTSGWYHLFHSLGLLDIATISRIPPASNPAAFDAAVYLGWVTPLARSFISYAAGIVRMPLPRFLILTVAGCLTWCFALTGVGWAVGANWSNVHHDFRYADFVVLGLLVLAAAYLVLRFIRAQHSRA